MALANIATGDFEMRTVLRLQDCKAAMGVPVGMQITIRYLMDRGER